MFVLGCGDGGGGGAIADTGEAVDVFVPETDGVATDDAPDAPEPDGAPETVAPDTAPDTSSGCGAITPEGQCDGSEIVYCQSIESGVARYDCGPDYECGVVDGVAECRLPGSAGCGPVTYEGACEGDVVVYCNPEVTEVTRYDCGVDGLGCAWVDDTTGYWCVDVGTGGSQTVRGAFYFEKRQVTENGLGAVVEMPVRHAIVQLRTAAGDALVATGATDADGAFEIAFDLPGGDVYAVALAGADDGHYAVFVRDCPLEDCGDAGYVHAVYSEPFTPSGEVDIGGWLADADGSGGAFNIFDAFLRGQDFAWQVYDERPPLLTGQWAAGASTTCGDVSCFSARSRSIYVLGIARDTDQFDDPVLGHEFGHYLEDAYSRSDSPGGDHDGSPTDPRLAWGEGYGTFTGCEIMGSPIYIDTALGGASVTDVSRTGLRANPNGGLRQALSEYVVAETLWTLSRGSSTSAALGGPVIFDVLRWYFPIQWFADRGVGGVDLVDFLDGLLCRGAIDADPIQRVAVDRMRFPYDFGGPSGCR